MAQVASAFKALKRTLSKDSGKEKEAIRVFTYNAEDLSIHQYVSYREEELSKVSILHAHQLELIRSG